MKLFVSKLHYKKIDNLDFFEAAAFKVLFAFSWFYKAVVAIRNHFYDKRVFKQYVPKVKTISIGNITTGGVGKTPVTAEIARFYAAKGNKVAILSRGYGGRLDNSIPNIISNGNSVFYDADMAGDEPAWLANNCCNTAVITCSSRAKAAELAENELDANLLILDDGFQHRKMGRNLDLVLIDNKNRFGNEMILPAGPLREPLENINRADKIILVNKSYDDSSALLYCEELEKRFNKKVFLCKIVPDSVYNIVTNAPLVKGERILAFSAIGQPKEFYDFLKVDYNLAVTVDFEDHHFYDESNLKELLSISQRENIKNLVTTEKDAVKIKDMLVKYKIDINIYALKLKAYLDIEEICND